jgi:hypothetical protein
VPTCKLKRRRAALWEKDPHCVLCGVKTILPLDLAAQAGVDPSNLARDLPIELRNVMATIDHEVNRFEPMRRVCENRERTRLTCWKCNNDRARSDYDSLPSAQRAMLSMHRPAWNALDK